MYARLNELETTLFARKPGFTLDFQLNSLQITKNYMKKNRAIYTEKNVSLTCCVWGGEQWKNKIVRHTLSLTIFIREKTLEKYISLHKIIVSATGQTVQQYVKIKTRIHLFFTSEFRTEKTRWLLLILISVIKIIIIRL